MRLVQLLVSSGRRSDARSVLEDEGIDYVLLEETEEGEELIQFPIPTEAVDHVFASLADAGIDGEEYTVVTTVETAQTPHLARLEERFVTGTEEGDNVAQDEIRSRALGLTPGPTIYYFTTILSALVATAGLLLGSSAIVVGSMVIAPQISAALTGTVGTVLDDHTMIEDGLRELVTGLAVAVLASFAFAWMVRSIGLVPTTVEVSAIEQVSERVAPGVLTFVVGICAGAAGAIGLATALPVSLVGVMIAAALIPAAAVAGIGTAWGDPVLALGALVVLVVNAVSIVLAGLVVFWALGYRPEDWTSGALRSNVTTHSLGLASLALAALVVTLCLTGVALTQHAAHENAINEESRDVLNQPRYDDLELVSTQVQFYDGFLVKESDVTVVVRRPADESYPHLTDQLAAQIEAATGTPVTVTAEFVDRTRSSSRSVD